MNRSTNLDERKGLPEEWLFLLKDHPREIWGTHANLGPMAEFWLQRHNGFRRLGRMLEELLTKFREDQIPAERFAGRFAPLLQQFLTELHHHHQIEDHHYFPVFIAAEKRLVAGFELLESDHELIHHRIETVIGSANRFLGQIREGDRDRILRASDDYADTSGTLIKGLLRHLDDEEDLIVPVILDRGERQLGLS